MLSPLWAQGFPLPGAVPFQLSSKLPARSLGSSSCKVVKAIPATGGDPGAGVSSQVSNVSAGSDFAQPLTSSVVEKVIQCLSASVNCVKWG